MIIPREHFDRAYQLLRQMASATGCSVLVLCACDADALCCLQILTALLQTDDIAYRKRPVATLEDLQRADEEIRGSAVALTALVLINCGGGVPLHEVLPSIPEAAVVYVIDSHRPYHTDNVADEHKVILFGEEEQPQHHPATSRGDDDDDGSGDGVGGDDDEEGGDGLGTPPAKRAASAKESGAFYGPAAALTAFRVAEAAHKEKDPDLLWWAVVGCTDQLVHRRIGREEYDATTRDFALEIKAADLGDTRHRSRITCSTECAPHTHTHTYNQVPRSFTHPPLTRRYTIDRLRLVMLKHWTLYDSMLHSPVFATKLGIWRQNGRQQLDLLLAKMGVPLAQSQQQYSSMPADTKRRVMEKLPECVPASILPDRSVLFATSFEREYVGSRRVWLSATDVVYAVTALIESGLDDAFWTAYSALSGFVFLLALVCFFVCSQTELINRGKAHFEVMMDGIALAIKMQRDIVVQAAGMISSHAVVLTGPLRYAILSESALLPRFVHPLALSKLAHFVMDAVTEVRPAKKPFILCAFNEKTNAYLTVAVTHGALSATNTNSFGTLFEKAARQTRSRITHHGFDSAVLEIQKDDLANFLDSLNADLFDNA